MDGNFLEVPSTCIRNDGRTIQNSCRVNKSHPVEVVMFMVPKEWRIFGRKVDNVIGRDLVADFAFL